MTGATIVIDDAAATDTIRSVKERVFAANSELYVHRQRLVYRPGPRGMDALANDLTLGGTGVPRDGSAELDVSTGPLTRDEVAALGPEVFEFTFILANYYCDFVFKLDNCSKSESFFV
jgi:hypothetical protein